jgi:enterochelin esterase family protein
MQSAQRVLLVLFAGSLQVSPAQTIAPPLPTPATEVMHPSPPTRSAHGPGAPNWTVVGAGRGSTDLRVAAGMNAPVDQNGDFLIGPDYRPAPELNVARHSPKGIVRQFTLESRDSRFYPGIARDAFGTVDPDNPRTLLVETHPQPWERAITVYVPAA